MSKFITLTVVDQENNIVSIDTIDTSRIVRTKYIVPRRSLLVVIEEPFSGESYTQVPIPSTNKNSKTPNFENRKIKQEGFYAQVVTNPDEIQELHNILTNNAPGTLFPGFKLSDEFEVKMEEFKKAQQEQMKKPSTPFEQGVNIDGQLKSEMLSDKEEAIIKNIKDTVVN